MTKSELKSIENNPSWKGYLITPCGKFKTTRSVCNSLKISSKTLQKNLKQDSSNWYYEHPNDTWWMKERLSVL